MRGLWEVGTHSLALKIKAHDGEIKKVEPVLELVKQVKIT